MNNTNISNKTKISEVSVTTSPSASDALQRRWLFIILLVLWIFAGLASTIVVLWLTRIPSAIILLATIIPPILLLYRITATKSIIIPSSSFDNNEVEGGFKVDNQHGALIIYIKKNLKGTTINLKRGFSSIDLKIDIATNTIERQIRGRKVYAAVFPALEPGNYTVYDASRNFLSRVTVHPGQVSEVDWR